MGRWVVLPLLAILAGCGGDSDGDMFVDSPADDGCPRETAELPGVGDVSHPQLIPESKIDPVYPEGARDAGVEGTAIIQAVLAADGLVCGPVVLRVDPKGWGFETAAIEAMVQWRYEPALKDGQPVAVYFTFLADFKIHRRSVAHPTVRTTSVPATGWPSSSSAESHTAP